MRISNTANKLLNCLHLEEPLNGKLTLFISLLEALTDELSQSLPISGDMDPWHARVYGTERVVYEEDLLSVIQELRNINEEM